MASMTIRNLEPETKERLRVLAAQNGRSMEEEARVILREKVAGVTARDLWVRSRALFSGEQGIDLSLATRSGDRDPPNFDLSK